MSKKYLEPPRLNTARLRRQAKSQLKVLRTGLNPSALDVATRLTELRSFSALQPTDIVSQAQRVQLKHLLALAAEDHGFASWAELVQQDSLTAGAAAPTERADFMYVSGMQTLINRWFSDYHESVLSLRELGGYLLPYRNQFFVTERAGIELLGLSPDDPDWRSIAWNWVRPADANAWQRLVEKRLAYIQDADTGQ